MIARAAEVPCPVKVFLVPENPQSPVPSIRADRVKMYGRPPAEYSTCIEPELPTTRCEHDRTLYGKISRSNKEIDGFGILSERG